MIASIGAPKSASSQSVSGPEASRRTLRDVENDRDRQAQRMAGGADSDEVPGSGTRSISSSAWGLALATYARHRH